MHLGRLLVPAIAAITLAGCGSGSTFTAEELVDAVNEHGAGLELGEPLTSTTEGVEIYAVELIEASEDSAGQDAAEDSDDHHGGGSLLISEDDDAAGAEFRRCEQAVSLICYRAANAVLMFEDTTPRGDLDRIERAIRAMGSE